jgi:hypothetical protein
MVMRLATSAVAILVVLTTAFSANNTALGQDSSVLPTWRRVDARPGLSLEFQLQILAEQAANLELTPIVELGAVWCAPCHQLDRWFSQPLAEDVLAGTLVIQIDIDAFPSADLARLGLHAPSVPVAYLLGPDGRASAGPFTVGATTQAEAQETFGAVIAAVVE